MNFREHFYVITIESSDVNKHNKFFVSNKKYTNAFVTGSIINAKMFETKLEAAIGLLAASKHILENKEDYDDISNLLRLDSDEEDVYMNVYKVGLNSGIEAQLNISVLESYSSRYKFRLNFTGKSSPKYLSSDNILYINAITVRPMDDSGAPMRICYDIEDAVYVPKHMSDYIANLIFNSVQSNDMYFNMQIIPQCVVIGKLERIELVSDDGEVIETYMNKYIKEVR